MNEKGHNEGQAPSWLDLRDYDYRDRLTSVDYRRSTNDTVWNYVYDSSGGLSANKRRQVYATVGGVIQLPTRAYYNYYPDSPNRLMNTDTLEGSSALRFTYDDMGRLVSDTSFGRSYHSDYRNMMDKMLSRSYVIPDSTDTVVFAYNYKNQRVMKIQRFWYKEYVDCGGGAMMGAQGGAGLDGFGPDPDPEPEPSPWCPRLNVKVTFYIWSGNEIIAEYDHLDQMQNEYIFANGMRIAQRKMSGSSSKSTTYLNSDYQGSTRLQTSSTKAITAKLDYDVWGRVRQQVGTPSAYTYTGQEWDEESNMNLFYMNARYYDPTIGRFTTPDPLPSDLNPYSYCNNNPAMMTDPSGMAGDYFGGRPATEEEKKQGGSVRMKSGTGVGGHWVCEQVGIFQPGTRLTRGGERAIRSGIIKGGILIRGYTIPPKREVVVVANGKEVARVPLNGSETGKAAGALLAAFSKGLIKEMTLGVGIVAIAMGQVKFSDMSELGNFDKGTTQSYGESGYTSQGTININSSIVDHQGTLAGVLVKEITELAKYNGRNDVLDEVAGSVGLEYKAFDESNGGCSLCNADNGAIGWNAMFSIIQGFGDYWSGGYTYSEVQRGLTLPGWYWEEYDYPRIEMYCRGIGCGH